MRLVQSGDGDSITVGFRNQLDVQSTATVTERDGQLIEEVQPRAGGFRLQRGILTPTEADTTHVGVGATVQMLYRTRAGEPSEPLKLARIHI